MKSKLFAKLVSLAVLGVSTVCLSVGPTSAITYNYIGHPFTDIEGLGPVPVGSYTSSMSVIGSFTVASPLAPGLFVADITASVLSFSFFDGRNTITTGNADFKSFKLTTDTFGAITAWNIVVRTPSPNTIGEQEWSVSTVGIYELGGFSADRGVIFECTVTPCTQTLDNVDRAERGDLPGAWSTFTGVPGPIAGAGLPGLVFACGGLLAWYRRRQSATQIVA